MNSGTILWWGRSDPEYSRNRILRQLLESFGWRILDFHPRFSRLGDFAASLKRLPRPDLVWVPCFRQRDLAAAARFSRRHNLPLLADPLISAYDKQVFERGKLLPGSRSAERLLRWEGRLLATADCLLADTPAHAEFFQEVLGVDAAKLFVVPVGAEETLFRPTEGRGKAAQGRLEVLFFGSFIPLQGPQVIVEAARLYQGPQVDWRLVGDGPLYPESRRLAAGLDSVSFESWVPYADLPGRIAAADILLGIFGTTQKASRVVPNKVYQAAACARPVITMASAAYPEGLLRKLDSGFSWVAPGNPREIADAVRAFAESPAAVSSAGIAARQSYDEFLSLAIIRQRLAEALGSLGFSPRRQG